MGKEVSLKIDRVLKVRNPVILASGILGLSGYQMKRVAEAGAGAIVTKSIGLEERQGYPNPTLIEVQVGFLNAMGLPNPGAKEFLKEIRIAKESGIPVIVSIYGFSPEEYAEVARIVKDEADAIELNVSCPHVKGVDEIGKDAEKVAEIVKAVKKEVSIPVFTKLSPNVSDITEIGRAAEEAGSDGITAINTVKAMAIDIEVKRPILWNKIGGLSGPAIKPIAVRCVYELYEALHIPIIGCGGIVSWQDAIEFMLAGASYVQVGSAIALKGLGIFKEIIDGMKHYLIKHGYDSIEQIIGLAHEQA